MIPDRELEGLELGGIVVVEAMSVLEEEELEVVGVEVEEEAVTGLPE